MATPAQPATPENAPAPGTQPETPETPPAAPPAPAQPEPAATATPEPVTEPKAKAPKFEGEFDPAKFETLVANIRGDVDAEKAKREAAEAQVKKVQQDQADFVKKMATLFGVETDEAKPPTPEELAQQLAEEQTRTKASDDRARQTTVELAVYKTASKHGGDPDALLDSRSFANAIAKLDPADNGFDAAVGSAVKAAVEANSKLAAKAPKQEPEPTPAGGAPMDGAGGGKRQLGAADAARMTPEELAKAVKDGRFKSYLGG
ncbi:hypothetical protein OG384_04285 [Streptomyces sp. NBC_01324]|uniref:hypothetical protein n=1 Tax=Streptomyces sp. NBC_01324 TaxID=2903826 RepID=UPI002E161A4C|nr:hypothetical protein OG384_04285 [Streptomyces sp. NBC_01324]